MDAVSACISYALAAERDVTRHGADVEGRRLRDPLDGLGDLGPVGRRVRLLFLDVQILGVLAHNDEIDIPQSAPNALDRPHVGVQLHLLPQRDDGGAVALRLHRGRADGAEEGAIAVGLERRDRRVRQRGARLLERLPAGFVVREGELEAKGGRERFEDAAARGDNFAADAVTGDEAWRVVLALR
jgi:hypothetical protein